jgi:hypothetical protein
VAQRPPKLAECLEALNWSGLLMLQDERLPSVTTIVAGAPVKGSWWGHAKGQEIFSAAEALKDNKDAAVAKLIDGKVTYIHRRHWADLKAVGEAKEPWQLRGLSPRAEALLRAVERTGELRTDLATALSGVPPGEMAKAAHELEARLLVYADELHTETGAHAKVLSTWQRWGEGAQVRTERRGVEEARARFEEAVAKLDAAHLAHARLPWARGTLRRLRPPLR